MGKAFPHVILIVFELLLHFRMEENGPEAKSVGVFATQWKLCESFIGRNKIVPFGVHAVFAHVLLFASLRVSWLSRFQLRVVSVTRGRGRQEVK
jgi:hypothetical protein